MRRDPTPVPVSTGRWPSDDLWETHADWWIDGFTDGADPEYEEQILPLAAEELAVRDGCSTSAAATVRSAAWLRARRRRGRRHRPDVEPGQRRRTSAAAAPASLRAGAGELPFADASFDAVVACLVFEHIRDVDERDRRGGPGAACPAAGSASSSTTRCCRRRTADGSTTRSSIRPSSTGGSVRTSSRTRRSRRSRRTCSSRSSTARSAATSTRSPRNGLLARADGGTGAAAGLPRQGRRVRGGGDDPAAALPPRPASGEPRTHRGVADILLITGLSGRRSIAGRGRARGPRLVRRRQPADSLVDTIVELGSRPGSDIERLALVVGRPARRRCCRRRSGGCAQRPPRPRAVPRCVDARAGEALRHAAAASTRSTTRPTGWSRRSSASARCSQPVKAAGRPRHRHDRPERAPAEGVPHAARSAARATVVDADRGRELRLQARPAARRRHRDGRALPAEPALGRGAAAADRPRPAGARLRARAGRGRRRSSTGSSDLLDLLLPAYEAEGKSYLTVAIGCTGGRHRSRRRRGGAGRVAARARAHEPRVTHRDLGRLNDPVRLGCRAELHTSAKGRSST